MAVLLRATFCRGQFEPTVLGATGLGITTLAMLDSPFWQRRRLQGLQVQEQKPPSVRQ
jgi:hypothetical protein